jgi:hypothetical protein
MINSLTNDEQFICSIVEIRGINIWLADYWSLHLLKQKNESKGIYLTL